MTYTIPIALLAGLWRVVDGRGKEWFPGPTQVRNLVTLTIACATSYLALGITPEAGVFSVIATASIVVGKTDWSSYGHMLVRYTAPAIIAVAATSLFTAGWPTGIWYISLCAIPGVVYPTAMKYGRNREWLMAYLPEFIVGAAVIGGIGVL